MKRGWSVLASTGPASTGRGSVSERLVDELAQLRADRVGARRQQLGEERHGKPSLVVDPERGAGRAAPGQLAGRAGDLARGRVDDDGEAEAEADPAERRLGVQRAAEGLQVLVARQVVAAHIADRARAEEPDAVEFAGRAAGVR